MQAARFFSTAVLSLLLGSAVAVFAQQQEERREEANPPRQQEPRRDEAKPAPPRQEEAKPSQTDQAKPPKQEQQREQQARPAHAPPPGQQAQHPRPAGKSAHIPDEKFRANFGRQHTFVINRPVVVQGQPQFVYAGYAFVLVDPWPLDWVYTDDCYIDYIDGDYFLFDVLHPGVRVALFVVM